MKMLLALAAAATLGTAASAATFTVGALANSSTGGAALPTISVVSGQNLFVSASTSDLWSAGALPRWSNADGLVGNLTATGSDESGELVGTPIGQSFGLWSQNSYSAPYGSLVGEIGGVYQLLGTSFSGTAWGTGTLNLYYWDSFADDNFGSVNASVAVPEAATWAMMIAGFGLIGIAARGRRRNVLTA